MFHRPDRTLNNIIPRKPDKADVWTDNKIMVVFAWIKSSCEMNITASTRLEDLLHLPKIRGVKH